MLSSSWVAKCGLRNFTNLDDSCPATPCDHQGRGSLFGEEDVAGMPNREELRAIALMLRGIADEIASIFPLEANQLRNISRALSDPDQ
jgi:hypothetical protein